MGDDNLGGLPDKDEKEKDPLAGTGDLTPDPDNALEDLDGEEGDDSIDSE
jgi:hypothetical protein